MNICCGYLLELSHEGTSDEYPQHMFVWRTKESIYLDTSLIWSYRTCHGVFQSQCYVVDRGLVREEYLMIIVG